VSCGPVLNVIGPVLNVICTPFLLSLSSPTQPLNRPQEATSGQRASDALATTRLEVATPAEVSEPAGQVVEPVHLHHLDGEWVFMPRSMAPLLEHFDFEFSTDIQGLNDTTGVAGPARLRLSRCVS